MHKILIVLAIITLGIVTTSVIMQPMEDTQKPLIDDGSSIDHQ